MKGSNSYLLLEFIKDSALNGLDFLEAFLTSGRSTKLFLRKLYDLDRKRQRRKVQVSFNSEEAKKEIKKYRLLFYKLKQDGLIAEINRKTTLTLKGKSKLEQLRNRFIFPEPDYPKESSPRSIIVVFDIPESLRDKRSWLRSALKNLRFKMIQQSVWSGKNKIPVEFLNDLHAMNLSRYVEIFEVVKYGSLE